MGILKIKNEATNEWQEVLALKGDTGAQGAKGDPGIQGPKGEDGLKGDTGPYFTPTVSAEGIISWSNNGGLDNPVSVSIKGPQGDTGAKGDPGIQGEQGPAGPNEITTETQTNLTGLLKGNGTNVQLAEAGTDYATPDDAKAFVVTFTEVTAGLSKGQFTPDKTLAEIYAAYNANKNIIGRFASGDTAVMTLIRIQDETFIEMGYLSSDGIVTLNSAPNNYWNIANYDFVKSPIIDESLSGSTIPLSENTIYNVSNPVGTYVFTPPTSGWAHGKFTTGSSVSVSFSGTFIGAAPTIEANKTYEFDVYNSVWAVQEVVSA